MPWELFLKASAWLRPSGVLSIASNRPTLSSSLDCSSLGRADFFFQTAFARNSLGNKDSMLTVCESHTKGEVCGVRVYSHMCAPTCVRVFLHSCVCVCICHSSDKS